MSIKVNDKLLSSFNFSGGEVQVTIPEELMLGARIEVKLESSNDILELLMVNNALNKCFEAQNYYKGLIMPYVPYARQDRVMNIGEALGIEVMAELINSIKADSVEIWDPHSDVTSALIKNVKIIQPIKFLNNVLGPMGKSVILVAPDAGAAKKVSKLGQEYKLLVVQAMKVRDVTTGNISGTEVYTDHVGDKDFFIIDDICDGGRTFIELAKKLREKTTGKIYLYVTHGIFSKGLEVFTGLIDKIFCPNIWSNVQRTEILQEIYVQ